MIRGTGIDLVSIARMAHAAEKAHFVSRVFTASERAYAEARGNAPECYAGMFAAKEAAAKALGTGFCGFCLTDIEVLHDAQGAPMLRFHGGAEKRAALLCVMQSFLSISHEKQYAAAQVILEG